VNHHPPPPLPPPPELPPPELPPLSDESDGAAEEAAIVMDTITDRRERKVVARITIVISRLIGLAGYGSF
jgi:hypothetical protein